MMRMTKTNKFSDGSIDKRTKDKEDNGEKTGQTYAVRKLQVLSDIEDIHGHKHAEYDESNTYVLERFNTTAGNPVKKILLKLNLSDHRLFKDSGEEFRYSDTTHLLEVAKVLSKEFQERCNINSFHDAAQDHNVNYKIKEQVNASSQ
ncbi:hypothetical protein Tco_1394560 [Tanacetum coccineum]